MYEGDLRNGPARPIRWRTGVWLVVSAAILLAAAIWALWVAGVGRDRRSTGERLAEIEAARAIPDSENAAILYDRLLQDPNATSLLDNPSDSLAQEMNGRALYEPWRSEEHPELIGWVRKHQFIIDRLLDASQFEQCRFPVSIDVANWHQMDRVIPMRRWAFMVSAAANHDWGEGRIDAALAKWRCLIRMSDHLCRQPCLVDHLLAYNMGHLAQESMARFIIAGNPAETHLQKIEEMPLPIEDHWAEYEREIRVIDSLIQERLTEGLGPWDYLQYRLASRRMNRAIESARGDESPLERAGLLYRRHIAAARGIRILVALRRYKNANGRWPERLDEVRSSLPEEILVDPANGGPFVYRLTPDAFQLHSTGANDLDENGAWSSGAGDDWPIWPPRERGSKPEQGKP